MGEMRDCREFGAPFDEVARLKQERDAYKRACERAGVCMTCVVQAPEPYGCTDCLNTGWDHGGSIGRYEVQRGDWRLVVDFDAKSAEWFHNE